MSKLILWLLEFISSRNRNADLGIFCC